MGRKLFVGNLPFSTGEQELEELFSQAGAVESVRVMRDQATGRARGFAFVEMESDEAAQQAIEKFHQYQSRRPRDQRQRGASAGNRWRWRVPRRRRRWWWPPAGRWRWRRTPRATLVVLHTRRTHTPSRLQTCNWLTDFECRDDRRGTPTCRKSLHHRDCALVE